MIAVPILCLLCIWVAFIYGFITEDMHWGIFGRLFSGFGHAAVMTLTLGGVGLLIFGTVLVFKEATK